MKVKSHSEDIVSCLFVIVFESRTGLRLLDDVYRNKLYHYYSILGMWQKIEYLGNSETPVKNIAPIVECMVSL